MSLIQAPTGRARTLAAPEGWQRLAACSTEDPDLFFPEPGTSDERIAEAKAVCDGCPVKQTCLDEAYRTNERTAICGGLTPEEREASLTPGMAVNRWQALRLENATSRDVAMRVGADMLVWLVKRQMPVEDVAARLGVRPRSVYQAFLMLVPPARERTIQPSAVERVLIESSLTLRALEQMGRPHEAIAKTLGTTQNVVSACVRVLAQRDEALRRISRRGIQDALERAQAVEDRVRIESRTGLTVDDVKQVYGLQILLKQSEGVALRAIAKELGICRETVRRAVQEMKAAPVTRGEVLTQNEMESAA